MKNTIATILLIIAVVWLGYLGWNFFQLQNEPDSPVADIPGTISEPELTTRQVSTSAIDDIRAEAEQNVADKPIFSAEELEARIHLLTNVARNENDVHGIGYDDELSIIARAHSSDMIERGFFDHKTPDGLDPSDRGKEAGYKCGKFAYFGGLAENLALQSLYSSTTTTKVGDETFQTYEWNSLEEIAENTVDGWMDSPGHRKNILTKNFDREGIGVVIATDFSLMITQNFC